MKRYHEEKHIVARRVRQFKQLNAAFWSKYAPQTGSFRKSTRCGGCRKSRCQLCHADKFPRRIPTRQEKRALQDLKSPE
jgi:hypothetical protein